MPVAGDAPGVQPGDAATLMVRPERVRVAMQPFAGVTSIPVTVESAIFQGPVLRLGVRAADGTELVAHVGADQAIDGLQTGAAAYAAWHPDAARLLAAGASPDPVAPR